MNIQDSRILIKRSTVAAVVPTIPASNDHTDGTWLTTDIYKGELFINLADRKAWTRDNTGIIEVAFIPDFQNANGIYFVASGTDTYTATPSPAFTAYTAGMRLYIKFTNANTTASTINLNGLGAKAIKKSGTTALSSGDIAAGQTLILSYDGTNFQIIGGGSTGGGGGGVPTSTTININGVSQDLSTNRTWKTGLADTGVFTSVGITYNSGTTINVGAIVGQIVDNETNPLIPTVTSVSFGGGTNIPVTTVGSGVASYIMLNNVGLSFQNTYPTSAERKAKIYIGKVGHPTGTINASAVANEPDNALSPIGDIKDLYKAIGFVNNGVVASANGANLNFNIATGTITRYASNFVTDKTKPNEITISAGTPQSFLYRTSTGAGAGFITAIDPTMYDLSGTITAIAGSTNQATNQYIYCVPGLGFVVQYGQTIYSTLTAAIAAVGKETFTVYTSLRDNAILVGVLSVQKGATTLNNTTQAQFFTSDKFGQAGGSTAGVSTATQQSSYNNSAVPQVIVTDTLGADTWRSGRALNASTVMEWQNIAGTTTGSITGNGDITGNSFIKTSGTSSQFLKADGSVSLDSALVHTTGTEAIAGAKTFSTLPTLPNQTINTVFAGPITGSAAAPTFRNINRSDLNGLYSQVGNVFSEAWTNLTNWGNVGTPSAAVSGGFVTLSGTGSTSTNYIKNTSYGKFNYESATITWTEVVGTISASSSGPAFALQSQGSLGVVYQNSLMVNVELSNASTGAIKWYYNGTLQQTSSVYLTPVAGNTLNCKLIIYPDKFVFEYDINGGKSFKDTLYGTLGVGPIGYTFNGANFAFFNFGNGATPHKIGALSVNCTQNKFADFLLIGNSIMTGNGPNYFYNRMATQVQKRVYNTIEILARASNSINDININEISALNATKIFVLGCSNDVMASGATTALTDLGTFITAVGAISNTAAPTGYTFSNGNLILGTELPRDAAGGTIATFNTNLISTYGIANIINMNGVVSDGTNNFPQKYTYDKIHPNDIANSQMADEWIKFFSLIRRDIFTDNEFYATSVVGGQNTWLGNDVHITNFSNFKALAFNAFANGNWTARATAATLIGHDPTNGFFVATNNGLSSGTAITVSARLYINFSGNIITGNTVSDVYRNTNTGSNVSAHLMVDPVASLTSGNSFSFDSTNGLGFNRSNGTRRIQRASITITNNTDTAASEQSDLIFSTQLAGAAVAERLRITAGGGITLNNTVTAAGTTGAQTINKPSGSVNFAAGATTLVVTNSLATTSSQVIAQVYGTDATATYARVTKAAGSFTITLNASATAETACGFLVIN